jgi:hypothetical protein
MDTMIRKNSMKSCFASIEYRGQAQGWGDIPRSGWSSVRWYDGDGAGRSPQPAARSGMVPRVSDRAISPVGTR